MKIMKKNKFQTDALKKIVKSLRKTGSPRKALKKLLKATKKRSHQSKPKYQDWFAPREKFGYEYDVPDDFFEITEPDRDWTAEVDLDFYRGETE